MSVGTGLEGWVLMPENKSICPCGWEILDVGSSVLLKKSTSVLSMKTEGLDCGFGFKFMVWNIICMVLNSYWALVGG